MEKTFREWSYETSILKGKPILPCLLFIQNHHVLKLSVILKNVSRENSKKKKSYRGVDIKLCHYTRKIITFITNKKLRNDNEGITILRRDECQDKNSKTGSCDILKTSHEV